MIGPDTGVPAHDIPPPRLVPPLDVPALGAGMRYDTCVDRRLVHRSSIAEVFLTDSEQLDDERFAVAGQLPRGHSMVESDSYDFNILLEFVRQAGVLIAHQYFGVPVSGSTFLFRDLSITLTPDALTLGASSAHVVVDVTASVKRGRDGQVKAMTFSDDLRLDDRTVLRGLGSLMVMPPSTWKAIRVRGRASALLDGHPMLGRQVRAHPLSVGRVNPRNVVVTAPAFTGDLTTTSWLYVDQAHPYLFDHALDHLPGNLILEGARQSAVGSVAMSHGIAPDALTVRTCSGDFGSFGELDLATKLVARSAGLRYDNQQGAAVCPVVVSVTQGSREIAAVELALGVRP